MGGLVTGYGYGPNLSPLIDGWRAHYLAKGVGRWKAEELANTKARKGRQCPS